MNSLSGKDWVPKWEAKVVQATVTLAQASILALITLVTRIAATPKSQIASDCNRNSKKITATPKTPSEANSLDSGTASFVWFL